MRQETFISLCRELFSIDITKQRYLKWDPLLRTVMSRGSFFRAREEVSLRGTVAQFIQDTYHLELFNCNVLHPIKIAPDSVWIMYEDHSFFIFDFQSRLCTVLKKGLTYAPDILGRSLPVDCHPRDLLGYSFPTLSLVYQVGLFPSRRNFEPDLIMPETLEAYEFPPPSSAHISFYEIKAYTPTHPNLENDIQQNRRTMERASRTVLGLSESFVDPNEPLIFFRQATEEGKTTVPNDGLDYLHPTVFHHGEFFGPSSVLEEFTPDTFAVQYQEEFLAKLFDE